MKPSLSNKEIQDIITLAYNFGFKGFGGQCAAAAMAINKVLFNGHGTITIAVNDALWTKKRHFAGHVVVKFNNVYWDADGRPKTLSDIDDWGDLSDDPYYKELAIKYGISWSNKRAAETAIFEIDSESELPFGHDESDAMAAILSRAVTEHRNRNKSSRKRD